MEIVRRHPSPASLHAILQRARNAPLTYAEVGASFRDSLPPGYHHIRMSTELGRGDSVWQQAVLGLRTWQAQRGAGLVVYPSDEPPDVNHDVVLALPLGLVVVAAPCRVTVVRDDAGECAFAYGTLSGHPERGEEAFSVCRDAAERVTFRITGFSRHANALTKATSPIARLLQTRITRRYLASMLASSRA